MAESSGRKAEIMTKLREMAGTPSQMAAILGIEQTDSTFKRALADLTQEGVLVAEGDTKNRSYRNTTKVDGRPTDWIERQLLALPPCAARHFSDEAHKLGLEGKALGDLKLALGIETHKGEDGRWYCRVVHGYTGPTTSAREDAGLTTEEGWTDSLAFGPAAARAAKAAKGGVIASRGGKKEEQ